MEPRYPDFGMAPLSDLLVGEDQGGRTFLRFSATLVNVGSGPLIVAAHRPFPLGDDWRVLQRVDDAAGGYSERETGARLLFAGDAHDHWHVIGAEAHQPETLGGEIVGGLVKSGFCFFDNVDHATDLPGAPPRRPIRRASAGPDSTATSRWGCPSAGVTNTSGTSWIRRSRSPASRTGDGRRRVDVVEQGPSG